LQVWLVKVNVVMDFRSMRFESGISTGIGDRGDNEIKFAGLLTSLSVCFSGCASSGNSNF
jgi:hypothetical protein